MLKVMFVCTGNICRSAMAEKLLKYKIQEKGLSDKIEAYSSGIYAYTGDKPTSYAIEVMSEEYGVDMTTHEATNIDDSDIYLMDLIFCMTKAHKETLLEVFPNLANKIYTIKEYIGLEGDVVDPYGRDKNAYYDCARILNQCIDLFLTKEGF